MAKQSFTTGQVLTAAQMTDLQATAMGGGAPNTKTANYVLVAADAGTTVAMNAAGATTITVDTGLFSAGDTVFIQNIGAGLCTITAGTATVDTAGGLILPQYDAGILYFTSTGVAIFYDYIQVGAVSPLTTKGDLYTFSTSDTRLGVGANDTVLTADSAEATGLKWAAPAAPAAVGCSLYMTASQSLANATQTTINWTNEIYDTNSLHDNVTNNDRITIPSGYGGKWLFTGLASFNSNATGYRFVRVFVNDTGSEKFEYINSSVGSGNYGSVWFSFQLSLSAADYVNFDVFQNSGGSLNLNGAPYGTNVQAYYLGA